jgi:hypothetical protein
VVTSNQSTIWASLRVLGVTQPVTGFGRLLDGLAAAPTAAGRRPISLERRGGDNILYPQATE